MLTSDVSGDSVRVRVRVRARAIDLMTRASVDCARHVRCTRLPRTGPRVPTCDG